MSKSYSFVGIDYGSKMAGTTAVAFWDKGQVVVNQSKKKQDADQFLQEEIKRLNVKGVFIDAPLSLPNAFYGRGDDFFYRKCDRDLSAMSPMFLGGLTARAMKLKASFEIPFYEAYPGALAKELILHEFDYKKDINRLVECRSMLENAFAIKVKRLENWHQFDAVLAFCTGIRRDRNDCKVFGDEDEGLIHV